MADYPRDLVHEHTLADGRHVTIRPVRDDDEMLERSFVSNLSGESRYLRFQKWVRVPSERLVSFLTHVDHERHLALVCVAEGRIVGEARYVVNAGGRSCDFGIVIADDWHRSGIAGVLMAALMSAARARGLETIESQVLHSNTAMLRFARGLGFTIELVPDDPTVVRIVKALEPRDVAAVAAREDRTAQP
jgi:acetyltransferase